MVIRLSTRYSKLAIGNRRYRRSGELGAELCYRGFYRWHVVVAGHGDSMVAVHHEVGIPDLVELDRRQIFCAVERPVDALPLMPHARPRGQEGSVEVPHRPTLPTIWSTSTTLVPRWRRLLATECSLLRSSKESNRFEVCSRRIRAATARRRARRLARVKSASTCSLRSMYVIISSSLLNKPTVVTLTS